MDDLPSSRIALRFALGGAMLVAAFAVLGPIGALLVSPLPAVLLARPILQLLSASAHQIKRQALHALGVHYAFRGVLIAVLEDDDQHRWVSLNAARVVLPSLPRDQVIGRLASSGVHEAGGAAGGFVRVDDLIALLSKSQAPDTVKFKTWLQRDVYFPSAAARRAGAAPASPLQGLSTPSRES